MGRYGIKWDKEETVLAFELYCVTPFGKINKTNEEIRKLSSLLGRTPDSVALKMSNLAHYDPELQKRNVRGMSNAGKLDKEVFEEYSKNMDMLFSEATRIRKSRFGLEELPISDNQIVSEIPLGGECERLTKVRMGQSFFRRAILNSYNNMCCITGLAVSELLVASHIKPWAKCDESTERTNPSNALCLNPLHDKLFDRGLITFNKEYELIISSKFKSALMDEGTKTWILSYERKQIMLPSKFIPDISFIEYHNDCVFEKTCQLFHEGITLSSLF